MAAATILGSNIDEVREVACFAGNQVFRLQRGDRVAFLKYADRLDLEREVAVIEAVRERGVPVAAVEAFDPAGDVTGTPCVVLGDVGGEPLAGAAPEFCDAGAHLRAVHDVALDGFGAVAAGPALHGGDATWFQTMQGRAAGVAPIVAAGLVPRDLAARATGALDDHREVFDSVESARLLHGDFHPRHVYAVDGHITGIIDWGDATAGDPVFDLGRLVRAGIRDQSVEAGFHVVEIVLDSYGDAPWLRSDLAAKLLLYGVVFTLWSMHGEFQSGAPWPPWWPIQCEALALLLAALDRC
jgi:aminoglycoside phosphotransferase (APT) family kinase protein